MDHRHRRRRPLAQGDRLRFPLVWALPRLIAALLVMVLVMIGVEQSSLSSPLLSSRSSLDASFPSKQALTKAIRAAASYLVRASHPTGKFDYQVTKDSSGNPTLNSTKYNILRHAGAVYALVQYCTAVSVENKSMCKKDIPRVVARANAWLRENAIRKVETSVAGKRESFHAVLACASIENPEAAMNGGNHCEVKLGGLGLALVALMAERKLTRIPGHNELEASGIAWMIASIMQRKEGSFYSYWDPMIQKPDNHRISLYYPGEAILGLIEYYVATNRPLYLDAALRGMVALHRRRLDLAPGEVECDHWALIATAKLLPLVRDQRSTWQALTSHARLLLMACYSRDRQRMNGSDVWTNSFATGLEGMLAILPSLLAIADETAKLELRRIFCLAERTICSILAAQDTMGAFAANVKLESRSGNTNCRRVLWSDHIFRVDTTQHSLSALLSFVDALPLLPALRCERLRSL